MLIVGLWEVVADLDLVCADGLFRDAGFPEGRVFDNSGGDNLDFWAHDADYTRIHAGNLGDATDPFDGFRYNSFDLGFLPGTLTRDLRHPAVTGLRIDRMHRQGSAMIVDVRQPRWSGVISETVHWQGNILVDGDLTIAPEGELIIHTDTRVRVAGTDRTKGGNDPEHCELIVQGMLEIATGAVQRITAGRVAMQFIPSRPVFFGALASGDTWYGIRFADGSDLILQENSLVIEDATCGITQSVSDCAGVEDHPTALEDSPLGQQTHLRPNYPNPFNAQTTLRFSLSASAHAHLVVYNALGQKVRTLVDGVLAGGEQTVSWNSRDDSGRELASGRYFFRLDVDGQHFGTRQMALVR